MTRTHRHYLIITHTHTHAGFYHLEWCTASWICDISSIQAATNYWGLQNKGANNNNKSKSECELCWDSAAVCPRMAAGEQGLITHTHKILAHKHRQASYIKMLTNTRGCIMRDVHLFKRLFMHTGRGKQLAMQVTDFDTLSSSLSIKAQTRSLRRMLITQQHIFTEL